MEQSDYFDALALVRASQEVRTALKADWGEVTKVDLSFGKGENGFSNYLLVVISHPHSSHSFRVPLKGRYTSAQLVAAIFLFWKEQSKGLQDLFGKAHGVLETSPPRGTFERDWKKRGGGVVS